MLVYLDNFIAYDALGSYGLNNYLPSPSAKILWVGCAQNGFSVA